MTEHTTEATQKIVARIAGWTLLLLMASGFTGMFAFANPIMEGDAVATAQNILAHERAFRGSLACEIVMLNCNVVLALALYALLKPVSSTLALLGSCWRIANAGMLGVGVAATRAAAELISDPDRLNAILSKLPRGWERKNLQVLIHTETMNEIPISVDVEAIHS